MTEFSPSPSEPPQTVLATDSALRAVQQRRPASAHTMTIEELATQVGMTVRNIRAYNSAGLLPPPTLRQEAGRCSTPRMRRSWSTVPGSP